MKLPHLVHHYYIYETYNEYFQNNIHFIMHKVSFPLWSPTLCVLADSLGERSVSQIEKPFLKG